MDNEPEEVIKHQMLETRAALAEKLETLEQQVVGTVHSATSAVTDTVECVKEAVQSTVEMAKTSVQDTVEAVKDTFDVSRHVREHPWLMVGGSVVVGYIGGSLLRRAESAGHRAYSGAAPSLSNLSQQDGAGRDGGVSQSPAQEAPSRAASAPASHRLLGDIGHKFETEVNKLKGLALGAVLGVVRDMIAGSAPPQLSSELAQIMDSATIKLGGQPIRGPVLSMFQHASAAPGDSQQRRIPTERGPLGAARCQATGAVD